MKIQGTLNGQPIEIDLPDVAQLPRLAVKRKEAAQILAVSLSQLWKLESLGKITKTEYGTYVVKSLEAHLAEEMRRGK